MTSTPNDVAGTWIPSIRASSSARPSSRPRRCRRARAASAAASRRRLAPSRSITGSAARACATVAAGRRAAWPARPACACGIAVAQGPSSSSARPSARSARVSAPTGSPVVLAEPAEPEAGHHRGVPVRAGGELAQPGRERLVDVRRVRRAAPRPAPRRSGSAPVAGPEPAQHAEQIGVLLAGHRQRVVQRDRHGGTRGVGQLRRRHPVAQRLARPPRPEPAPGCARRASSRACRARRAAGRGTPRSLVGDARRAARRPGWSPRRRARRSPRTARRRRTSAAAGRRRSRRPIGAARRGASASSPASASRMPAELADRLQHPVADAGRALPRRVSSDWSTRPWTASRRVAEHRSSTASAACRVKPSWNSARRRRARCSAVVEQVPGPLDDRQQRLVPVRRAAVAAAQQREPVLAAGGRSPRPTSTRTLAAASSIASGRPSSLRDDAVDDLLGRAGRRAGRPRARSPNSRTASAGPSSPSG